jgi:hypothetical protein
MRNICILEMVNFDGYVSFKNQKPVFALAGCVTFHRDSRNSRASPLLMADFRIG